MAGTIAQMAAGVFSPIPVDLRELELYDQLPVGVYEVHYDDFYNRVECRKLPFTSYPEPDKLYGTVEDTLQRVTEAHIRAIANSVSTGVILSGTKGMGKSLTGQLLINRAVQRGVPALLVRTSVPCHKLAELVAAIGNAVVFIDEVDTLYVNDAPSDGFGKLIDSSNPVHPANKQGQSAFLSVLDGTQVRNGSILLVFTLNNESNLHSAFIGRMSRFRYHIRHGKVSEDVIGAYVKDRGLPEDIAHRLLTLRHMTPSFNFDVLRGVCDELLLYPEQTFDSVISTLNLPTGFYVNGPLHRIRSITSTWGNVMLDGTDVYVQSPLDADISLANRSGCHVHYRYRSRDYTPQPTESSSDPTTYPHRSDCYVTANDLVQITNDTLVFYVKRDEVTVTMDRFPIDYKPASPF